MLFVPVGVTLSPTTEKGCGRRCVNIPAARPVSGVHLPATMIISVIFAPALSGRGFSFLEFLEAVEVILWDELATGAAAAWGGGRRGLLLRAS